MARDLTPLFEPRSVAVVGVSADKNKWGYWFARDALKGAHRRQVFLVGRRGGELFGQPVYPSLAELPEAPELVILSVPASGLEQAVDDSLAAGARALVAIAAGLGELGAEGRAREVAIVERVRAAGAVLVGPNCLGVFDSGSELDLASNPLPGGPVGFVSQSGNIALEAGLLLADLGLGFSRLVSVGNQADLDATELIGALAAHEATRVIGVYLEDFGDGRAFAEAARTAGKPVVLLTVGRTAAGSRAARSHTGALTSDFDAVDAACRAAGIYRVDTPRELVDLAQALLSAARPTGRRVAVVGDGGGYGAVAADLCGGRGLELPELSSTTQAILQSLLPATAATANPVDLAGAGEQDTYSFARATRALLEAPEVDAVLFTAYFGGYSEQSAELRDQELDVARLLAQGSRETGRPLFVHTMYWDSPPARALRAAGIPVYRAIESAVTALARLIDSGEHEPLPELPSAATTPLAGSGYFAAREALAAAGVSFGDARAASRRRRRGGGCSSDRLPGRPEGGRRAAQVRLGRRGRGHRLRGGAARRGRPPRPAGAVGRADGGSRRRLRAPDRRAARCAVRADRARRARAACTPRRSPTRQSRSPRSTRPRPSVCSGRCAARPFCSAREAVRRSTSRLRRTAVAALSRFAAERPEVAEVEVNPLLVRRVGAIGLDARIVL